MGSPVFEVTVVPSNQMEVQAYQGSIFHKVETPVWRTRVMLAAGGTTSMEVTPGGYFGGVILDIVVNGVGPYLSAESVLGA